MLEKRCFVPSAARSILLLQNFVLSAAIPIVPARAVAATTMLMPGAVFLAEPSLLLPADRAAPLEPSFAADVVSR
jgi:hypothetical protein